MKKTIAKRKIYNFPVYIKKSDKWFVAICPELRGCYTQGKTLEDALKNMREVIELNLEDRKKLREVIPFERFVGIAEIEVAI